MKQRTMTGVENVQQEKVTAETGKNYFFRVSVPMGWMAGRVPIEPVNDEQGRKQVMGSKRAETTSYQ